MNTQSTRYIDSRTQIHISVGSLVGRSAFGATFGIPSSVLLIIAASPRLLRSFYPLQSIRARNGELAIFCIPPYVDMISRYAKLVVPDLMTSQMRISEISLSRG